MQQLARERDKSSTRQHAAGSTNYTAVAGTGDNPQRNQAFFNVTIIYINTLPPPSGKFCVIDWLTFPLCTASAQQIWFIAPTKTKTSFSQKRKKKLKHHNLIWTILSICRLHMGRYLSVTNEWRMKIQRTKKYKKI